MSYFSLTAIQKDLKSGTTSCLQLVEDYLSAIHCNRHLNAFIEVFEAEALQQAVVVDQKLKEGRAGRLAGMVISIKDVICYKNHHVSAASRMLEGFTSLYSATVIERVLEEDAIIIGRTNCDEFAMGSSSENSAFGNVLNGLDTTRVPGGSSGGAAVSVQMNMCLAALGSDTGGSVRQPASFCGLIGMKPSYGRISRHGLIAYASSFDQIGTITQCVADAAILLEVMAGADEFDSTVSTRKAEQYSEKLQAKEQYTVAWFPETVTLEKMDDSIRKRMQSLFSELQLTGHRVTPISFPYTAYLVPAYYILTTAEASTNLNRYDGIRYGYHHYRGNDLMSLYRKNRSEGMGNEVKRRIMLGTFVLSAGYYDAYYSKAQQVRRMILDYTENILATNDFIILPTTPTVAFKPGNTANDPVQSFLADVFTVHANLSGLPAISLPLGKDVNGLPFGVQIMSARFDESNLLAFSDNLMQQFGHGSGNTMLKTAL